MKISDTNNTRDWYRATWQQVKVKAKCLEFWYKFCYKLCCSKMAKGQDGGLNLASFIPKMSFDRQTTLLKLLILSIACVLCESFFLLQFFFFFLQNHAYPVMSLKKNPSQSICMPYVKIYLDLNNRIKFRVPQKIWNNMFSPKSKYFFHVHIHTFTQPIHIPHKKNFYKQFWNIDQKHNK